MSASLPPRPSREAIIGVPARPHERPDETQQQRDKQSAGEQEARGDQRGLVSRSVTVPWSPRPAPETTRRTSPGAAAASGRTACAARAATTIALRNRGARAGAVPAQSRPAEPTRVAGDPDHRSPSGMLPLTTLPGSISTPAPISAPGANSVRVRTRARAPIRSSPTTSSSPSSHQPYASTSGSSVPPSPIETRLATGGSVPRRAPAPTGWPQSHAYRAANGVPARLSERNASASRWRNHRRQASHDADSAPGFKLGSSSRCASSTIDARPNALPNTIQPAICQPQPIAGSSRPLVSRLVDCQDAE